MKCRKRESRDDRQGQQLSESRDKHSKSDPSDQGLNSSFVRLVLLAQFLSTRSDSTTTTTGGSPASWIITFGTTATCT